MIIDNCKTFYHTVIKAEVTVKRYKIWFYCTKMLQ